MNQTQYVVIDHGLSDEDDVAVAGPYPSAQEAEAAIAGKGHAFQIVPLWTPDDLQESLLNDTAWDEDDLEQQERNARTDLCEDCKPTDHPTCSLDASCACCRTTIEQMEN